MVVFLLNHYLCSSCCSLIGCLSQVNYHARCYHLTPFSAVAVMYSITKAQVLIHKIIFNLTNMFKALTCGPKTLKLIRNIKNIIINRKCLLNANDSEY